MEQNHELQQANKIACKMQDVGGCHAGLSEVVMCIKVDGE